MSPSARLWPLLLVLLSGAAAYISQTPEPPGAVIYDRHWPYLAPGGGATWWWRPQRQRHDYWRRQEQSELAPTGLAQTETSLAQTETSLAQTETSLVQTETSLAQDQEQGQEEDQLQEENQGRGQGQERGDDQDQSQRQVQNQLHRWPEFLQMPGDSDYASSQVLSRQRRKHSRPQRWKMQRLCEERNACTCYSHKTRATFCCDCLWGSCFPAAADALLPDGRTRRMDQLATGDRVLTVDRSGDLISTAVLGFLDRRPATTGEYLHLQLSSGHRLRLSANHVTFTRRREDGLFAGEVRPGDELLVEAGNGTAVYSAVRSVSHTIMNGAFVPLTEHGTLLVDGVLASNYASFPHALSHTLTTPFRLWPSLLSDWFVVDDKNVLVGGLKSLGRLLVEAPPTGVLRLTSL